MKTLTCTQPPTIRFEMPAVTFANNLKITNPNLEKYIPEKITHTVKRFWMVLTYQV